MEGSGRKRQYTAAERLYSIYLQTATPPRDEAAVVQHLIHFMAVFYHGDGALTYEADITFDWQARRMRTKALLAQGDPPAAVDAFRLAYAGLIAGNETMMRAILALVIDLAAAGAPAQPSRRGPVK